MMVRSLCSHWKQPLYFDFDQTMTREILFEAIRGVEEAGYRVVAIVSDLGATNRKLLWTEKSLGGLGVSHDEAYFEHPNYPTRKIYTFADTPHLLKLLRNHIVDEGLRLPSGTVINKDVFLKLLAADSGEFRLAHKLELKHVQNKGQERQRVFLAAQLLSERVGHAIAHCFGEQHAEEAAFVILVDQVFDTLNSRHPMDPKVHRSGFGMEHALDQQYTCLMEFTRLMRESRVVGHRSLLPFQQGFIMTSCALRGLYSTVTRPEFAMKYVLTSRLNQDCVENFFSQVYFWKTLARISLSFARVFHYR
ncbi:Transposable element P transposase [Amphibalanus amphitrite]|uniref:Transposable element P transposase n=1 Tax=Amphibalanus amphitrite TaxID=1232801 RepID=A0A6A4VUD0_AMPAM|nr:Transposable element P transposase [Amphibalanus amphitrite]